LAVDRSKVLVVKKIFLAALLCVATTVVAQQPHTQNNDNSKARLGQRPLQAAEGDTNCGDPVNGIVLCLYKAAEMNNMAVEIRNVGLTDSILNLGYMVGNRHYPTAVVLVFDDSTRNPFVIRLSGPQYIAGRVDPLIAPLPRGASLKLPLRLAKAELTEGAYVIELTEPHTVRAQFDGKRVSGAETNGDTRGLAAIPYWEGTVRSNALRLDPTK
jgi:hypothetical protein